MVIDWLVFTSCLGTHTNTLYKDGGPGFDWVQLCFRSSSTLFLILPSLSFEKGEEGPVVTDWPPADRRNRFVSH